MTPKLISSGAEAREKILQGFKTICGPVAATMGPGGKNVILKRYGGFPVSTKDGVTVASEIGSADQFTDAGIVACRQAALKTNSQAGDGTTTATVLATRMLELAINEVNKDLNPHRIKEGMIDASNQIKIALDRLSTKLDHSNLKSLEQICTISANSAELGKIIASAFHQVGKGGFVDFKHGDRIETYIESTTGFVIDNGYESIFYCTNFPRKIAQYEGDIAVIVTDSDIRLAKDIVDIFEGAAKATGRKPLLIISNGVDGDALNTLNVNRQNDQSIPIITVTAPFVENRQQALQDIAAFTGAYFIPKNTVDWGKIDYKNVLGWVQKVTSTEEQTNLEVHASNIEKLAKYCEDIADHDDGAERIAQLNSKVAIVKVGSHSMAEAREVYDRVEDSVMACRSALEQGIIPGGGAGLIVASSKISPKKDDLAYLAGFNLVKEAIKEPTKQILTNSAVYNEKEFKNLIAKILGKNRRQFRWTIDGITGDIVSAKRRGILDPVKVTKLALESAVSIASLYATTDYVVVQDMSEFASNE